MGTLHGGERSEFERALEGELLADFLVQLQAMHSGVAQVVAKRADQKKAPVDPPVIEATTALLTTYMAGLLAVVERYVLAPQRERAESGGVTH